jgi:hypothetical protein
MLTPPTRTYSGMPQTMPALGPQMPGMGKPPIMRPLPAKAPMMPPAFGARAMMSGAIRQPQGSLAQIIMQHLNQA